MKNSIIWLLFLVMVFSFFQDTSGQDKPVRRALLVGIGNYVDNHYENPFSQLGFGAESRTNLENFDRFCGTHFTECQTFLENPAKLSEAGATNTAVEIRTFYEFLRVSQDFATKKNWFADYILYRRSVYNAGSINLGRGPHNDVLNMTRILTLKYEFDEIYIVLEPGALRDESEQVINKLQTENPKTKINLLKNIDPTNDGIQKAFRESLIKPSCDKKNCKALFYFSGHGSQRKNEKDANGSDETLVTLDAVSGKMDLRDKELGALYNNALDKTSLTVITDSCHSGDNYKFPLFNFIPKTISDDPRPVTNLEPNLTQDPVEKGLLFFAASRTNETAGSNSALANLFGDPTGQSPQGIFTHHLVKTLISIHDTTAQELFERTRISMEKNRQQPVFKGKIKNQTTNFFGVEVDPLFSIKDVQNEKFSIVGGRLEGLVKGIQLKSDRICLILESVALQTSTAKQCPGTNVINKIGLIGTGVKQSSWAIPTEGNDLNFWISSLPPRQQIETVLTRIGNHLETDPTREISHLLYYQNSQWYLCLASTCNPTQIADISFAENDKVLLVKTPGSAEDSALENKLRKELVTLSFGVSLVNHLEESDYFLTGSPEEKYAWVNRNALHWRRPLTAKPVRAENVQAVMPSNTRYVPLTLNNKRSEVVELAQNLSKMYSWITLKMFSPTFIEPAVKLLVSENNKPVASGKAVTKGSYLRFSVSKSTLVKNKFFYLISFSDKGVMAFENESSYDKCSRQVAESDCFIEEVASVPENFGNKAFVLLSTDERIVNAHSVLNSEGVKSPLSNPLLSLIYQMQSGQKDASPQPTIQDWQVDSFYLKAEIKK